MILSVIIPIYNSSRYLYKCLKSLASIELSDVEFILVDDGSNDDSCDICKQFCDRDERFSYYYKCNGGVSSARNYGLNISKGKYILFLDSDDYINCNILSAVSYCEKYNIKFLVLRRYYITRDCDEFEYNLYDKKIFEQQDQSLYKVLNVPLLLDIKIFVSGSAEILFRNDIVNDTRMDETLTLLEDVDFFLKILYKEKLKVYLYNCIITFINDEVIGSLTKKKVQLNSLHLGSIDSNPYLLENDKIRGKIFWFEAYFHCKKICYADRIKYFFKYKRKMLHNIYMCKYLIGCLFLLLTNIDINKIRIYMLKTIKQL